MQKEIALGAVSSSQLHAIGHDGENTLAIQFKSKGGAGSVYHYANFSAEKFKQFQESESKGIFFRDNIKKNTEEHPFTKIEKAE